MDEKQVKQLEKHLEGVIVKTVNGKIEKCRDEILEEFEKHAEKMKPIYDVYATASNTGKFVIWISKIMIAVGVVTAGIIGFFKYFK